MGHCNGQLPWLKTYEHVQYDTNFKSGSKLSNYAVDLPFLQLPKAPLWPFPLGLKALSSI